VLRVAPKSDVLVLLACLLLTVIFDMVIAVSAGVVLAALLFMKRMSDVADVRLLSEAHPHARIPLPPGVQVYDVGGPLFFGAAQRAMSALNTVDDKVRVVILDLTDVPVMDATGLVALESVLDRLHAARKLVVIGGARPEPLKLMARAGWKHREWLVIYREMTDALAFAAMLGDSDLDQPHEARKHVQDVAKSRHPGPAP
jgi:SulP family sulfate permease